MMRTNFRALAMSLKAGSVKIEELQFVAIPGVIPDMEYHKFRVERAIKETKEETDSAWWSTYVELRDRFERIYVPGVAEWTP